jgi:hypothetical protein
MQKVKSKSLHIKLSLNLFQAETKTGIALNYIFHTFKDLVTLFKGFANQIFPQRHD